MPEVSETKIAKTVNDAMDVLQKIYSIAREQRTDADIAMAKVAISTWQTYVNQVKQDRENRRFTIGLVERMTRNQDEFAEYVTIAMPELKKMIPAPKAE